MKRRADGTEVFWRELRARIELASGRRELSLEEAEERMEAAGEEPLPANKIEAIVQRVTAADAGSRTGGRIIQLARSRYAKAAAVLLGFMLLLGAGGWIFRMIRYPTETLGYGQAIEILVNPRELPRSRLTASFGVFHAVKDGIEGLRAVEAQGCWRR